MTDIHTLIKMDVRPVLSILKEIKEHRKTDGTWTTNMERAYRETVKCTEMVSHYSHRFHINWRDMNPPAKGEK